MESLREFMITAIRFTAIPVIAGLLFVTGQTLWDGYNVNPYGGKTTISYIGTYKVVKIGKEDGSLMCSYPVQQTPNNLSNVKCPEKYDGKIFNPGSSSDTFMPVLIR